MPKITAKAKLVENLRTIVDNSRTHTLACDLPAAKGGNDTGPTALELAIMALSDCAVTIFAKVAKQSNIEVKTIEVITEAEKPENSPILEGVKIKVNVSAKARKQLIEAIWRRTEANCPVVKIFTEPIPVQIELSTETVK
jgi:putative redox protein